MASRHQGRHKPRHHNHAVKPAHTFKTALPPLPKPGAETVSTSGHMAVATATEQPPTQAVPVAPAAAE